MNEITPCLDPKGHRWKMHVRTRKSFWVCNGCLQNVEAPNPDSPAWNRSPEGGEAEVVAFGVKDEAGVVVSAEVNGLLAGDKCEDFSRSYRPGKLVALFAKAPAKRATVWPDRKYPIDVLTIARPEGAEEVGWAFRYRLADGSWEVSFPANGYEGEKEARRAGADYAQAEAVLLYVTPTSVAPEDPRPPIKVPPHTPGFKGEAPEKGLVDFVGPSSEDLQDTSGSVKIPPPQGAGRQDSEGGQEPVEFDPKEDLEEVEALQPFRIALAIHDEARAEWIEWRKATSTSANSKLRNKAKGLAEGGRAALLRLIRRLQYSAIPFNRAPEPIGWVARWTELVGEAGILACTEGEDREFGERLLKLASRMEARNPVAPSEPIPEDPIHDLDEGGFCGCCGQEPGRCELMEARTVSRKPEPTDVVAAVRKKDGRYWVGKRNSDGDHAGLRGLWEYPGGKVEPDEQLREALVRELGEEFPGCSPTIGAVLDSINATYQGTTYRVTFFEVEMDDPTETPCHEEVGWFTPREVCQMDHLPSGTIFNARHLAAPSRRIDS